MVEQLDILERILAVRDLAVVLHGPAGSGKTSAAIALYRRFVSDTGRAKCLLILPNGAAVTATRQSLLTASGGTLLAPQVMTFASLAQRILSASSVAARMISPMARHLLLRSIVGRLHAKGKLRALGNVAETPGLISSLDRSIAELKRAAAEPDDLAAAAGALGGDADGKIADLLEIYRRYQHYLHSHGLYDLEGQMWQARDELAKLPDDRLPPAMAELTALAVDGFTDFTPTQLRILSMLQRRLRPMLINLPLAADGRARLWQWTGQTLERVRSAFGDRMHVINLPSTTRPERVLPHESLFNIDAPPAPPPPSFRIIAAAGIEAEVAAVARRVKRLLVQGAGPGSIALLARSMEPYRATIDRVFREHDIPIASAPVPLADCPLVRLLLQAAAVAPEYNFRDVLAVIKSSYFNPAALGPFDSRTAAAAEAIIRQGNVLQGRQSYAQAADRLLRRALRQEQAARDADPDEPCQTSDRSLTPRIIPQALAMMQKLFDLAETAQSGDLIALVDALQLDRAACRNTDARTVARDLRSLAALEAAIDQVRSLHFGPEGAPPWRPSLGELARALAAVTVPAERGESLVDVMDVLDARALRYEHVFILGVGEGVFPRKYVESSLIGEADRQAWRGGRIELDRRGDLTAREMLLFYLAVTRASGSLTISFLASDASGRPASPSPFLLSLLDPMGGWSAVEKAGLVEHVTAGQFLPAPHEIATSRDAFNAAFASVADILPACGEAILASPGDVARTNTSGDGKDEGKMPSTHEGVPPSLRTSPSPRLLWAARGLLARHRRWRREPCDCFDGRLDDPGLLRQLAERFPAKTVFSASQFGSYGQCPWQFFAAYVLQLQPLTEPQRTLEAVDVGEFCHAVLFRAMTSLRQGDQPIRLGQIDQARLLETLDHAIQAQSELVESRRPPYPVLWRIQRDRMRQALRAYVLFHHGLSQSDSGATHFELSFGLPLTDDQLQDGHSRVEPVRLNTPIAEFALRGRIDRVDQVVFENLSGLLVIDYKTGRLPSPADMDAGRNLQLPLYAAAAEQLLGRSSLGGAFHHVGEDAKMRFFAAFKYSRSKFSRCEDYPQRQAAAMAKVQQFIDGMRNGRFELLPTGKCPSWCAYRRICHFSPSRLPLKLPSHDAAAGGGA